MRRQNGFTLIELMIAIGLTGLLLSMAVPALDIFVSNVNSTGRWVFEDPDFPLPVVADVLRLRERPRPPPRSRRRRRRGPASAPGGGRR